MRIGIAPSSDETPVLMNTIIEQQLWRMFAPASRNSGYGADILVKHPIIQFRNIQTGVNARALIPSVGEIKARARGRKFNT